MHQVGGGVDPGDFQDRLQMEDHRLGPTQHRLEQGHTIGDVDDDITMKQISISSLMLNVPRDPVV